MSSVTDDRQAGARTRGRYLIRSPFEYHRFVSREVMVGNVAVGGDNPIRLQSMTIADTMDTQATVREAIELFEAGAEIVRITAPGPADAENLGKIKAEIRARGYDFPLVADIHFSPKAALIAVEHVEKVRINPGNFADRKKFKVRAYNDAEYEDELERVRETFRPLVRRARELKRAMRIGTNHGSLSDRIMNRFGDTPLGMVESAIEFIKFARDEDYYDIIVSMKASNPQVMVQAYRLLIERFYIEGFCYPLHLGVTEAGDGQDGRIKSAVGIGALLDDGIGDTIRVSLTEDAVFEIPAARRIAAPYNARGIGGAATAPASDWPATVRIAGRSCEQLFTELVNPYVYTRFLSETVQAGPLYFGSKHQHRILLPLNLAASSPRELAAWQARGADAFWIPGAVDHEKMARLIAEWQQQQPDTNAVTPLVFDLGTSRHWPPEDLITKAAVAGFGLTVDFTAAESDLTGAARNIAELADLCAPAQRAVFVHLRLADLDGLPGLADWLENHRELDRPNLIFSIECARSGEATRAGRALAALFSGLARAGRRELPPLLLRMSPANTLESALYDAAIHAGGLLLDGLGDGLLLPALPASSAEGVGAAAASTKADQTIVAADANLADELLKLNLDLLQGVRLRLSKTEFISCPSCGRTLFDLQSTTARIKARTGHLKGVKIAVMGCIVNGPGEMADADFGYVGAAPGHIHLYKGKEIVKPNIPSDIADEELVNLLKEHGVWREKDAAPGTV